MNKFIFLILLLFMALLHAQTPPQPAEITLLDGSVFEGFADITNKYNIEFRIAQEDEPETLNETEVKRLAFINYPYNTFEYVLIKKRLKLLQKVCEGPIDLYAQYPESFATQKPEEKSITGWIPNGDGTSSFVNYSTKPLGDLKLKKERFWLHKKDGDELVDIKSNFKKKVAIWFHDCPELIGYVNDEEWQYSSLKLIVEFYNDFCGTD